MNRTEKAIRRKLMEYGNKPWFSEAQMRYIDTNYLPNFDVDCGLCLFNLYSQLGFLGGEAGDSVSWHRKHESPRVNSK